MSDRPDEMLSDSEEHRNQCALHAAMERFSTRWAPRRSRASSEFQADLLLVVQAVHRDAIRPMQKALEAAFAVMPPIVFQKVEDPAI